MRRMLQRLRYRRQQRNLVTPKLLREFAGAYPSARFVEIGANDGQQHDHLAEFIHSRDWTGVMVEPVPYIFERLRENYGSVVGVALENAAVGRTDGQTPFYFVRDADSLERSSLPDWYDGIGSFSRDAVMAHSAEIPDVADRIVESEVATLTFTSLCRKHGLDSVDLVVIDTEGHDWEIIRHIDLDAFRPRLVIYEHFHLSPADRADCRAHLEERGYATKEEGFDTLALRTDEDDSLARAWARLKPAVAGVTAYEVDR